VIAASLSNQVCKENMSVRDTFKLIMEYYIDYLRNGIKDRAPEWGLTVDDYMLTQAEMSKIDLSSLFSNTKIKEEDSSVGAIVGTAGVLVGISRIFMLASPVGWGIALATTAAGVILDKNMPKVLSLPDAETIYESSKEQLSLASNSLVEPFHNIIYNYINKVTDIVIKEQERVLHDFKNKLEQAHQGQKNYHEKVAADWQQLFDQAQQLENELLQLTDTRSYL
jgi:hypothetical protein